MRSGKRKLVSVTVEQNGHAAAFWKDYCTFEPPGLDPGTDISAILGSQRASTLSLLKRKETAPLETIAPDEDFTQAAVALAVLAESIATYNEFVTAINNLI